MKVSRTLRSAVVHHPNPKKTKYDGSDNTNTIEGQCLFKFAGTVAENELDKADDVIKRINPREFIKRTNINDIKKKNRKQNKEDKQLARYKVVSQLRDKENNGDAQSESLEDEEVRRMFHVYELVADNVGVQKQRSDNVNQDELLCNSVRMIRENLNITTDDSKKQSEYVYDLYFSPHVVMPTIDGILNVEEFSEELVLMNEQQDFDDDVCDDEDDENDESNWRNDYPDEEDYFSSDNEYDHRGTQGSSDEEDYVYNRYRTGRARLQFDPYADYDPEEYFDTIEDDYDES